jgi:WD40 repeat protein
VAIWIERGGIRLERIPAILGGEEQGHVVRSIGFTAEGQAITGDDEGTIRIWDPATQEEVRQQSVPVKQIRSIAKDGKWALFGGGKDPVHLWDLSTGKEVLKAEAQPFINALALSPDQATLVLGHANGDVSFWDIATKRERARVQLEIAGVSAVAWSPNGKSLAWGDETGSVIIAEGTRGLEPLHFKSRGGTPIRELEFSPDGKSLLARDSQGIRRAYRDEAGSEPEVVEVVRLDLGVDDRWNASGYRQKRWLLGIKSEVISPDKTYVLTMTDWGTALIWKAPGER